MGLIIGDAPRVVACQPRVTPTASTIVNASIEEARDRALPTLTRSVEIEGSDFLHTDEHAAIDEFVVMVRPLRGAPAAAEAMKARLMPPSSSDG